MFIGVPNFMLVRKNLRWTKPLGKFPLYMPLPKRFQTPKRKEIFGPQKQEVWLEDYRYKYLLQAENGVETTPFSTGTGCGW